MTRLPQKLDKKLATWRPEVAAQVEQIVTDVIELADTKETGSRNGVRSCNPTSLSARRACLTVRRSSLPSRPSQTTVFWGAGKSIKHFPLASGRGDGIVSAMDSTKYIYWQDQDLWLGYLQDYPDYWTQGQSLEDLEFHLRDLYQNLTSGEVPGVRKLAELSLRQ